MKDLCSFLTKRKGGRTDVWMYIRLDLRTDVRTEVWTYGGKDRPMLCLDIVLMHELHIENYMNFVILHNMKLILCMIG